MESLLRAFRGESKESGAAAAGGRGDAGSGKSAFQDDGGAFTRELKTNLRTLIIYAETQDPEMQREVAEKLANEAVRGDRQAQIVELGGLQLLLPLTRSTDWEVRRLSAHALANLSVNADNQVRMAKEGGIDMIISLLHGNAEQVNRQAAKALANLGVNQDNKVAIAR